MVASTVASSHIVIGKGFGDEGKGLAADYFALQAQKQGKSCLTVRHNGGAQAGHTVDLREHRFIFHQLSSGSFRNSVTYWASPFLPDLYKLSEEINDFQTIGGKVPDILADASCRCVYIDDILLNMALETSRGDQRHGSCGMGIYEAVVRSREKEACVSLQKVAGLTAEGLFHELCYIRRHYLPQRLKELSLSLSSAGEYGELLQNENVLYNAAETMKRASAFLTIKEPSVLRNFDEVIFEGAQGLLLDENYTRYAPHLTSSRTGIGYPLALSEKYLSDYTTQAVYVTRSYVTRHGRGHLPYEGMFSLERHPVNDLTNRPNPWQEHLRFAVHGTAEEFCEPIIDDIAGRNVPPLYLMVTHLNETDHLLCTVTGELPRSEWQHSYCPPELFDGLYLSDTPYAETIRSDDALG